MDFAKLVTEYMNQRTEGDPSFIVSEEALAFVDLMRADDMDRRASRVESQTSSDARGEKTLEESASEVTTEPVSNPDTDTQVNPFESTSEVITEPAAPLSSVAPGEASAAGSISEFGDDTDPAPQFIEQTAEASPVSQVPSESPVSEPSGVFTEDPQPVIANQAIRDEGVTVIEHPGIRSETTILAPESMPDFQSLLASFDRDYRAPDLPAGDADLIPEMDEIELEEPVMNTTEHAEQMMSGILSNHLSYDRRGA